MDFISNDSYLKLDSKNRKRVKECPCGRHNKDGKFVPFENFEEKGYCHSCDETFWPDSNRKEEPWEKFTLQGNMRKTKKLKTNKPTECDQKLAPPAVNFEAIKKSLSPDKTVSLIAAQNNFVKFLLNRFGESIAKSVIETYYIGTSNQIKKGTIFWLIPVHGYIRTGQIIHFDPETGKRSEKFNWIHAIKHGSGKYSLPNHLFFEHLLSDTSKPVAIAEGQKTAIIGSIYFPQFLWLSSGDKGGLKFENCLALAGRDIVLFPDLGAYNDWCKRACELRKIANVEVSGLLEEKAPNSHKKEGYDLADYLLQFEPEEFSVNKEKTNDSEYYATFAGDRVWDPEKLLEFSGLEFLCEPSTETKRKFQQMVMANQKLVALKDRLGLSID